MRGGLLVCGTGSDVGKSQVVAGLCRLLARQGVRVAPFKAQNMALNSGVTADGLEMGRAQIAQAMAARVTPDVAMNPILLKPTGDQTSQVVVRGTPVGNYTAAEYHDLKPSLLAAVLEDLGGLRARFDVVLAEGAGSPAEINLLDHDIVNLRIAYEAGFPAIVVGDIDRGGVFAALYGTVALLPDHYRALVRGFVINKFRGDPSLLGDGLAELQRRSGVPTLGVVPMVDGLAIDAEDSVALAGPRPGSGRPALADSLDVAVVRFPRISNFTDVDALGIEPGVGVRFVTSGSQLGTPDLVVLPGSKATVSDLQWLRESGLAAAVADTNAIVLGICGGYQMLGREIVDEVESGRGRVPGLDLLGVVTTFAPEKTTRQRTGTALGVPVSGYEIHHGLADRGAAVGGWVQLDSLGALAGSAADPFEPDPGEEEGAVGAGGRIRGTALHGLFENDLFRATFLQEVGQRRGKRFIPAGVSFADARDAQYDRIADLLAAHLDLDAVWALVESARPAAASEARPIT